MWGKGIIMFVLFILVLASIITYPMPSVRVGGQPLAIFLAVYCLLFFVFSGRGRKTKINTLWPLAGLLIGYFLSSIVAREFDTDFLINLVAFYIIFFSLANIGEIDRIDCEQIEKNIKNCFAVLIVSGLFLGVYGYYGYLTGKIGDEASYFWWNTMKYWGIHYTESTRNADVHYIVFPLIALIVLEKKKIFHWAAIALLGSAVLLSMARNTWVCMVVVLLVHVLLGNDIKKTFKYVLLGIGGFFVAVFLLQYFGVIDYFSQKVLSIFNRSTGISNSNSQRVETIIITLETIFKHPLGVGANQMYKYYHEAGIRLNHAENTYLNITAELGMVAAIAYTYIVVNPIRRVAHKYRELRKISIEERYILLASLYMALTMLFNTETINCYMWIIIGLHWYILSSLRTKENQQGANR